MAFMYIEIWGMYFTSEFSVLAGWMAEVYTFHAILSLYCCVMGRTKLYAKCSTFQ